MGHDDVLSIRLADCVLVPVLAEERGSGPEPLGDPVENQILGIARRLCSELLHESSPDHFFILELASESIVKEKLLKLALADAGVEAFKRTIVGGDDAPAGVNDVSRRGYCFHEPRVPGVVGGGRLVDSRPAVASCKTENIAVLIGVEPEGGGNGREHVE